MSGWSAAQRQALAAMGFQPLRRITAGGAEPASVPALGEIDLPQGLRAGLDRWMGSAWQCWPVPPGDVADAAFKRALWRRIRVGRRGA